MALDKDGVETIAGMSSIPIPQKSLLPEMTLFSLEEA